MLKLKIQRVPLLKVKEKQLKSSSHSEECKCHAFDVLQIMGKYKQQLPYTKPSQLLLRQNQLAKWLVKGQLEKKHSYFFPMSCASKHALLRITLSLRGLLGVCMSLDSVFIVMTGANAGRFGLKYDPITSENKQHLLEDKIICHIIPLCIST